LGKKDSKNLMFEDLFPTLLYSKDLKLNLNELSEYCLKFKQRHKTSFDASNAGGWQSPKLGGDDPIIKDIVKQTPVLGKLFKEILKAGEEYRKKIHYSQKLKMSNIWVNVNSHKDWNSQHIHPNAVLAGVYYINVPKNSGTINFKHPSNNVIEYDWEPHLMEKYTPHNSPAWNVTPKENKLLLFPGWLPHLVTPNFSQEERISISFNLRR